MNKFLLLTSSKGTEIIVNVDHVTYVIPHDNDICEIGLISGNQLYIAGYLSDIWEMLKRA